MVHALSRLRLRTLRSVIAEVSSGLCMRSGIHYRWSGVRNIHRLLSIAWRLFGCDQQKGGVLAGAWRNSLSTQKQKQLRHIVHNSNSAHCARVMIRITDIGYEAVHSEPTQQSGDLMPLLELQLIFHNRYLLPLPSFRDPPWMIATWAEPLLEQLKAF